MTRSDSMSDVIEEARQRDASDPLHRFRDQFCIPRNPDGSEQVYLCGNSLGLRPKCTEAYVLEELARWRDLGVAGHFHGEHPWMPYHEFLSQPMADLVGARPDEVVMMNSLTVNLHLMMATFYRPSAERHKILIEERAFPSDHYAVESQIRYHDRDPGDSLIIVRPFEGEQLIDNDHLCDQIRHHGETLAIVLLPGVQYYTGQVFDMERIARCARDCGAIAGFDLAHAAGNIPLQLHHWGADFAVWCSYKYLNSGPGSVGGCFVHDSHARDTQLRRLAGWWGHDKKTRFDMGTRFQAIDTAEGWQLSNPPILSLAAIRASLDVFSAAGGMMPLRAKSLDLTSFADELVRQQFGSRVHIVTPADPQQRGCQLSLEIQLGSADGWSVSQQLRSAGVVTDFRHPNVIRIAPVPLYNSFQDTARFVQALQGCMDAQRQ